jgi:hypothetical protein
MSTVTTPAFPMPTTFRGNPVIAGIYASENGSLPMWIVTTSHQLGHDVASAEDTFTPESMIGRKRVRRDHLKGFIASKIIDAWRTDAGKIVVQYDDLTTETFVPAGFPVMIRWGTLTSA